MTILFLFITLFAQDQIETETLAIDPIRPEFEQALRTFRSVERESSLQLFEKIEGELRTRQDRNEDENLMLSECLKHLAILTFPEKTEYYFEQMIRLNPGSEIPAGTMSPKFIRMFNELKAKLTGSLLVQVTEATDQTNSFLSGGKLSIDSVFTSYIESEVPIPVLAGAHSIMIEFPNFDPITQEMDIIPNKIQTFSGTVFRNSADLGFVTYPKEVKIFLNGQEVGKSEGEAPTDYAEHLFAENLTPAQASDVFTINDIKLGTYDIRFEKPCFQTRKISVPVEELKSYRFKPVVLQPSKAYLSISTVTPTAGIVFLDRDRIGSLPLNRVEICPGTYTVRVQFPDGQYIKRIELNQDDILNLVAKPQPSLAWFGIQEKEGKAPDQSIDYWFQALKAWNVLEIDSTDSNLISHDPFELLFNDEGVIGDKGRILTQTIKADLFVAARVVRKKTIIRFLEVAFWSPLSPRVKIYSFDFRKIESLKALLEGLDSQLELLTPWLGIESIQLEGTNGLTILSIHPEGPMYSLTQPGQTIFAINGNAVKQPSSLLPSDFSPINLSINDKNIQVTPKPAIVELPFIPKALCPQAIIARLEKMGNYSENEEVRASAKFNLARYYFFMKDYQQAFDLFSSINLPQNFGISKGTLLFYQGLCFQKLNLKNEAANSFSSTLGYPNSTLFGPDGPKAKLWAETQLSIVTAP